MFIFARLNRRWFRSFTLPGNIRYRRWPGGVLLEILTRRRRLPTTTNAIGVTIMPRMRNLRGFRPTKPSVFREPVKWDKLTGECEEDGRL